jgi:hypothetical protein
MAHIVSTTQPPNGALGDEWYNPTTNRLYKLIALGGTSVQWDDYSRVVLNAGNNILISANNTITANVSGGGGSALTVSDEGNILSTATTSINFVGTGVTATVVGSAVTVTSNSSSGGGSIANNSVVTALIETTTISATAPTATLNYDVSTQSVLYVTANAVNNWTLNVRANSTTTLNSVLSVGSAITIAHAQAANSITFYQSAFSIDGTSVTPKWATGTAPTNSTGTGIDMYVYTIMKTASATYTVLASRTNYT